MSRDKIRHGADKIGLLLREGKMSQQYTVVDSRFGARVKALREQRGWLMERLANQAEVSQRTISRIENLGASERQSFLTANLHRIANALEMTLDALLATQPGTLDLGMPVGEIPDTVDPFYRVSSYYTGELCQDDSHTYWVQHNRKFYLPTFQIVKQMVHHKMPGWEVVKKVSRMPCPQGPAFYCTDSRSDGLLIKFYKEPPVFLIDHAQKRWLRDEYSFENYLSQGRFLEWGHTIMVAEEIATEFPTGSPIQITPALKRPANGTTLNEPTVTLHSKPHESPSWKYHLQVAPGPDFTSPVYDRVSASPSVVVKDLDAGRYFWRMRGDKDGRKASEWSETWSFTVSFPDAPS